ncbi:MAG: SDR family NAD(P)-dependent oxidoreductase [Actinomycetota bacterium]|nr:SDR family NAD(P)-dependent oxidoreductase [Actinomycetota bacterium]
MGARSLEGAVVAVVGASGGLGAPLCSLLAERGAVVVAAGRSSERLQRLRPAPGLVVELDLRDPGAGEHLAAAVGGRYGRLDGLVQAAGVVAFGDLADTDDAVIEDLFLTNVLGPLWLAKRVAPLLAASGGFLLQLSAVVAEQPLAGMAAYSASKAALSAADRALARELRRRGVSVIDARPPHTETGLATRPLAGVAPRLPTGLDPELVAARVVAAVEAGETEVPSAAFAPRS